MPRYRLTCTKTGRYFFYASLGQCQQAAANLGLKDYEIEEVAK